MKARSGSAVIAVVIALIMIFFAAGCYPLLQTHILSPPVVGQLHRSDGAPVIGVRIVVSIQNRDSTCAKVAVSTTTDAAGRFELPAKTEQVLVIPFAAAAPYYRICVGRAIPLSLAYGAYVMESWHPSKVPTLVLTCVQKPMAESQDSTRVSCTNDGGSAARRRSAAVAADGVGGSTGSDRGRGRVLKARPEA